MYTICYRSINDKRPFTPLVWIPNPLQFVAANRNNIELQEARKRVIKTPWGTYKYTPSTAYMRHISRFTRGNLHGEIFGQKF